jgi:hypothetical protein
MATRKRKRQIQDDFQPETRDTDNIPRNIEGAKVPAKRQRVDNNDKLIIKPPIFPLSARKLRVGQKFEFFFPKRV